MAGLVDNAGAITKAWWHYLHLGQPDIESSRASMLALRNLGDASLLALRRGTRQHEDPRIQLRCAVVLHWLGERDGLPVLIDALRYGLRSRKDATDEIIACFLLIGAPDATNALIGVWQQLPNLNDNDSTAKTICRIWHLLHDPGVLTELCIASTKAPRLFTDTIAAFGAESLPSLRVLADDVEPDRRSMALRGLAQIPGTDSARIAVPMLKDQDAEVRALAATALEAVSGPITTLNALALAHRAGFSTAVSIQMLILYSPPEIYSLLAGLLTRYEPGTGEQGQGTGTGTGTQERLQETEDREQGTAGSRINNSDTVGAVREAALAFANCSWPHAQVTQLLCGLADRNVHPSIKAAVAQSIAERGRAGDDSDIQAYKTMWRQLTIVDREARAAAATALARLGEPIGKLFESLLDAGRPQGNLLRNLHSALINSQDVGQAMTEAAQHVAAWFNRVSRVTAQRFSSRDAEGNAADAAMKDGRVPELLRRMQESVLQSLKSSDVAEETVEALSVGVGTLRALARLDSLAAGIARAEIKQSYTTVKCVDTNGEISNGFGSRVREDVAGVLREAAGMALISIHGTSCFDTLMEGLNHTEDTVKVTSAAALGRLGDRRAVPLLQLLVESGSPGVTRAARDAVTAIRRGNPEMMTLLRSSSSAEAHHEALLRPSTGMNEALSPELLLRPGQPGPQD